MPDLIDDGLHVGVLLVGFHGDLRFRMVSLGILDERLKAADVVANSWAPHKTRKYAANTPISFEVFEPCMVKSRRINFRVASSTLPVIAIG